MSSGDSDPFSIVSKNKTSPFTPPNTNIRTPPNTITNTIYPQDMITRFSISQKNDAFPFSDISQPRKNGILEVQQAIMNFINPNTTTATTFTTTRGDTFSNLTRFSGQQHMQQGLHHFVPVLTTCHSIGASTADLNIFHQERQQQPQQQAQFQQKKFHLPQSSSMDLPVHVPKTSFMALPNIQPQVPESCSLALPNTHTEAPRLRSRSTEQKKTVWKVTADNITADMWSWRKYGRKPIKGSPHPRHYYKCNDAKACSARKLVERSTTESSVFIVTYIGYHNHEKPLHQEELFNITQVNPSMTHLPNTSHTGPPTNAESAFLSGFSPLSVSDLQDENTIAKAELKRLDLELEPELVFDADDDDDILIPNMAALENTSFMALPNIQPQVPESSSVALPNTHTEAPKLRSRSTEQKKTVWKVTANNITVDMWSWRKYGRKPIKGSPHPRHYYKCNGAKACSARKLVERSTTEPSMFIVTYIGDHNHEKPLHQDELFNITQVNPSMTRLPNTSHTGPPTNAESAFLSGFSPLSVSDLQDNGENTIAKEELKGLDLELEPELVFDDDDDDDILIPNRAALENIFEMRYQCSESYNKNVGGSDINRAAGFI